MAEEPDDHAAEARNAKAARVKAAESFYVRKKASRRLSSSQYFILPRLSLQSSFLYNPDSITDDTESEPTLVDLFVPKTFFTKCAGGDDASLEKAAKALQIPASEVGLVLRAPVTMLDANAKVLSQFVAPFQNDFYFWQ
eukprot:gene31225-39211_t